MYSTYQWNRSIPVNPIRTSANIVKVSGKGTISVQPNQASVIVGVVTEGVNLSSIQRENAEKMNNVIEALLQNGIQRGNIQTNDYRIELNYDYKDGQQLFRGYRITNLIRVVIEDISHLGEFVDLAVENGANIIRNIEMQVKEEQQFYNQALTKAIEEATQKAVTMGNTIGVNLNPIPIKIKEIIEQQERPRQVVLGLSTDSTAVPTPIEPGLVDITAIVEMQFSY
ncbi:SIMPL domain-containing protein [Salirhabdus sp. Marseille-P4669]|uniref:SIMPL domain-containing protein n=1 Tax=Salirhabdus sp. Marseille-P4669 TaxID=2042310 RepID=UPI000C7E25D3|nr:SIMPL domain-containing protein [Salirhabdus sp. Marseille-P4669]